MTNPAIAYLCADEDPAESGCGEHLTPEDAANGYIASEGLSLHRIGDGEDIAISGFRATADDPRLEPGYSDEDGVPFDWQPGYIWYRRDKSLDCTVRVRLVAEIISAQPGQQTMGMA